MTTGINFYRQNKIFAHFCNAKMKITKVYFAFFSSFQWSNLTLKKSIPRHFFSSFSWYLRFLKIVKKIFFRVKILTFWPNLHILSSMRISKVMMQKFLYHKKLPPEWNVLKKNLLKFDRKRQFPRQFKSFFFTEHPV